METIEIPTLEAYISRLKFLPETALYRGHGDVNYKLLPSIARLGFTSDKTLADVERAILLEFKRKAHPYLTHEPRNDFEWLFLAQHHGLPTRLLDWTYNPLAALFFALDDQKAADCCAYQAMFSPYLPPDAYSVQKDPFTVPQRVGVVPELRHVRYQAQSGVFTLHPLPFVESFQGVITKFVIPRERRNVVLWKLRSVGVIKALLFPSLDSLAYDIMHDAKERYAIHMAPPAQTS